jgi:hypothetical protein
MSLISKINDETEDLPKEEVEAAKNRTRLNALILAAVFLILTLAPSPYNMYAPLLFLIPLIYSIVGRARQASGAPTLPGNGQHIEPTSQESDHAEPYSYTSKDPQNPRRYKPID